MSEKMRMFAKVLAVVVVVGLVWRFGIYPRTDRYVTWEGTLIDAHKEYDGSKEGSDPHQPAWFPFRYYWRVERADGEEVDVEVPYKVWRTGRHMQPVIKARGERHPRMVAEAGSETEESPDPDGGAASPSPEADLPTPSEAGGQDG